MSIENEKELREAAERVVKARFRRELFDMVDALERALATPSEPSGWRPIETAPKQGWIWLGGKGWMTLGAWESTDNAWNDGDGDMLVLRPEFWAPQDAFYPLPPAKEEVRG
jgi:hypothetical protein